jgi:hypothetical protein
MLASTLKVVLDDITYLVDDPKPGEGLKATVSAITEQLSEDGTAPLIRHRDRINLDRARDRENFAKAAETDPNDLLEVRDRVLDFLTPVALPNDQPRPDIDDAVRDDALTLLDASDLLDRLRKTLVALGYAGDLRQPLLVYLVFVSRLLARPLNLVVGGPSAAGKNFLVALVARLFPTSATYVLNGMSERLLAYTDADLRHRTLIISEATVLQRDGIGASLLRSLAWEGHITYETVESTPDGLKPRRIEKPGPTGFVTTTTKGVEAELETRVLTINVADDESATRDILLVTAERANGQRPDDPDLRVWLELQRWLAEEGDREVAIHFAKTLAERYPTAQVRSRRDFTQLLTLIQASALLHQRQRQRDAARRVIAEEADYRIIFELGATVFGAIAAEGVTSAVRNVVHKVGDLTKDTEGGTVSIAQLASALGVHKSTVSRHVGIAIRGDFLVNEETGRGKPFRLRLGDPLAEERPALPAPEEVFGIPSLNSAPVQQPRQNASQGTETERCVDDEAPAQPYNGHNVGVAAVAQALSDPGQQQFMRYEAEIGSLTGQGCTVALRERAEVFGLGGDRLLEGVDGVPENGVNPATVSGIEDESDDLRTGRRCIDCSVSLPDGWAGFYCADHGRESDERREATGFQSDPWDAPGEEPGDTDARDYEHEREDDDCWEGITEGVL